MTEDPDRDVSAAELAQWLSCTSQSVLELTSRGVIERSGRGRYPLRPSVQRYCQYMRKIVTGRGGTVAAERARLARAQAELVETKMQSLRGELLNSATVRSTWCSMMVTTRARSLVVPARMAQVSPHLSRHDLDALDREIRAALEALADEAEHEASDPPTERRPPCSRGATMWQASRAAGR